MKFHHCSSINSFQWMRRSPPYRSNSSLRRISLNSQPRRSAEKQQISEMNFKFQRARTTKRTVCVQYTGWTIAVQAMSPFNGYCYEFFYAYTIHKMAPFHNKTKKYHVINKDFVMYFCELNSLPLRFQIML